MRSFTLNGTITAKRIKDLMAKIEVCKSKSVNIYLCSDGGDGWIADIFTDFTHRTKKKITFIGTGKLCSACLHIFVESKGKKIITPHTIAMIHFVSYEHESRALLDRNSYDTILKAEIEKENSERAKIYSNIFGLSEIERQVLKCGKDIVIGYDRLLKALPKINKYKYSK